jgi:hypothetical protein
LTRLTYQSCQSYKSTLQQHYCWACKASVTADHGTVESRLHRLVSLITITHSRSALQTRSRDFGLASLPCGLSTHSPHKCYIVDTPSCLLFIKSSPACFREAAHLNLSLLPQFRSRPACAHSLLSFSHSPSLSKLWSGFSPGVQAHPRSRHSLLMPCDLFPG